MHVREARLPLALRHGSSVLSLCARGRCLPLAALLRMPSLSSLWYDGRRQLGATLVIAAQLSDKPGWMTGVSDICMPCAHTSETGRGRRGQSPRARGVL